MTSEHLLDPAPFTIVADFKAELLRVKLTKLWDDQTLDAYNEALLAEMKKFQGAGITFDILGDLTTYPPQHQHLNEAREVLNTLAEGMGLRRCAIVVASVLVKYQVERLAKKSSEGHAREFFTSEKEALAWLQKRGSAS